MLYILRSRTIEYHESDQSQNTNSHQQDDHQVKESKPSREKDSNNEGNTISIDNIPSVTYSSFPYDNVGQQYNKENHVMVGPINIVKESMIG